MEESRRPIEAWRDEERADRGPEDDASRRELRALLEEAIDSLPETLRTVFVMREVEGMSGAETSETLGIEDGAVRVRLHRARTQLREWLGRRADSQVHETFAFAGERCDRIVARTFQRLREEGVLTSGDD